MKPSYKSKASKTTSAMRCISFAGMRKSSYGGKPLDVYLFITTQRPALVLPSRSNTPFFCMAAMSRLMVRRSTDKTSDIFLPEIKASSSIKSHIFFCLSVNCTGDKLVTSLLTFFRPLTTSYPRWNVTKVPPQWDFTVGIGKPAFSKPSRIFL